MGKKTYGLRQHSPPRFFGADYSSPGSHLDEALILLPQSTIINLTWENISHFVKTKHSAYI